MKPDLYKLLTWSFLAFIFTIIVIPVKLNAQLPNIYVTPPDPSTCKAGVLKESEKQLIVDYVNKIRAIHGLKPVIYDYAGDDAASQGALACAANSDIEHEMPTSWQCSTATAKYGTLNSNLFISWSSIASYPKSEISIINWMIDYNPIDDALGHRRAIINPFVKQISFGRADGTPKVQSQYKYVSTMTLKYLDNLTQDVTDMDIDYVAYPYHNYPPVLVNKSFFLSFTPIYDKTNWFNNLNIDYSTVEITVKDPQNKSLSVSNIRNDKTPWGGLATCLKWMVTGLQDGVQYTVTIKNLKVNGATKEYTYWFNLKDEQNTQAPGAAVLSSPANNATEVLTDLTLSWAATQFAENYNLQLSKTNDFKSYVVNQTGITGTSYQTTGLEKGVKYFWRVAAKNTVGTGPWSETWNFTTSAGSAGAPVLTGPVSGATNVSIEPLLQWQPVIGAEKYHIIVAGSSDFAPFTRYVEDENVSGTTYKIPSDKKLPTYKKIYWKVRKFSPGAPGDWSEVSTFTTGETSSAEEVNLQNGNYLIGNQPNPFANSTLILFQVNNPGRIRIEIFDLFGKLSATVLDSQVQQGLQQVKYDSNGLPEGAYFIRFTSGTFTETKIMQIGR